MSKKLPELLAPAGSIDSLKAALDNGADAVYFGLQTLNARQGAENFRLETLNETVALIRSYNAKGFLTLNIDLTARDIGKAAKILTAAENAGVSAILFTDPALILLIPHFPNLEFHFSTQSSITTTQGVIAARKLGVSRVVLAREMSSEEIKKTCNIDGIEVEVFTQGALCLCISGRCLLSSWGGGKSGNRGACTSPCRVTWRISNGNKDDVLSTQDLSLIEKLPEMIKNGVACLKIEGRLKNAAWVAKAVSLYRAVLDGVKSYRKDDTLPLGEYSGRDMTDGYYTGDRHSVFGSGGRVAKENNTLKSSPATVSPSSPVQAPPASQSTHDFPEVFNLSIMTDNKSLECSLEYDDHFEEWTLPKTVIKHKDRGLSISDAGSWLGQITIQNSSLNEFSTDDPEFLVTKKAVNKIADKISSTIHRLKKKQTQAKSSEIVLKDKVKELTRFKEKNPENKFSLMDKPNVVRIHISQAEEVLSVINPQRVIVEEAEINDLDNLLKLCNNSQLIISLPHVFFEHEVEKFYELCTLCKEKNIIVEVNGWDSWNIAQTTGVRYSGGTGIAVLNPLAAEALQSLGFESVSYSMEAGEKQLIDLARSCPAEAMVTVFSRPVLAHTRANLAEKLDETSIIRDSRGISLSIHFRNDITELRSTKPFSIAGFDSPGITARWICADLIKSPNPIKEWNNIHKSKNKIVFNFDKGLF